MKLFFRNIITAFFTVLYCSAAFAEYPVNYEAEFIGNAGSGKWAPYYMASNIHGIVTQSSSAIARLEFNHPMDSSRRFSYGFGAELFGGLSRSSEYLRFNLSSLDMAPNSQRPANAWIQQLYGDIKYRSILLSLGLKANGSNLVNDRLSSGDISFSSNSRPMPGFYAGFIDFQDIPFTNGWAQIDGEFAYCRPTDNDWLENHHNKLNSFITKNSWFNYKRIYFRSKPSQPFVFTVGLQASCQFGGTKYSFKDGEIISTEEMRANALSFLKAIVPSSGGSDHGDQVYYEGNHFGSWDAMGEIKLPKGALIKVYWQSPWEDGSGIGKLNGFDGLYGIEYVAATKSFINGAVIEYLDFTNQSGPIHWAPADNPGTPITSQATGADDYYNNYAYNGYQYYGMSIGTPFVKSILYNADGYLRFSDNRVRGVHAAVTGNILPELDYRVMFSHRKSWGTPFLPALSVRSCSSFLFEASYSLTSIPGLVFSGQIAFDRGSLYGNNSGALLSIKYCGLLNL